MSTGRLAALAAHQSSASILVRRNKYAVDRLAHAMEASNVHARFFFADG